MLLDNSSIIYFFQSLVFSGEYFCSEAEYVQIRMGSKNFTLSQAGLPKRFQLSSQQGISADICATDM